MILKYLEWIKKWDRDAFWHLYDASFDRVYRMIYHRTLDSSLTDDIVSEVFMKAFKTIDRFRWKTEWEYFSWILRIAYTTMIDELRVNEENESIEDHDESLGFETHHVLDIRYKSKLSEVLTFMKTLSKDK